MANRSDFIYMDDASTSPVRETVKSRVVEMLDVFGNPSSLHRFGLEAETILRDARYTMARFLGLEKGGVLFTGSGTEANNLAILGTANELNPRGKHMITTAIEHPAVLESARYLERNGWDVTYIQPDLHGDIHTESIERAIRSDTVIVSVMHVNNETGAILPIEEIAGLLRDHRKIRFHVDGTQAFGKLPVRLSIPGIDLYALSAHKIGALKGIGVLSIGEGVRLQPGIFGGGQEFGLRSGTENVVGADACSTAANDIFSKSFHLNDSTDLANWFVEELSKISGWVVHRPKCASPFIVNASLLDLRGEVVVHAFEEKGLFVSSGSACSTARGSKKSSHVLKAMKKTNREIEGAVRFSWSREMTKDTMESALDIVRERTKWLQSMIGI